MDISQKKQVFGEIIKKSHMFALIEPQAQADLLEAISKADETSLDQMVVKFDADEKKLAAMDKEISETETKKKMLEEQKKKFMADLQVNMQQDAAESEKKADEILKELKKIK